MLGRCRIEGEREGAGEVENAEVFGGVVGVGVYVDYQGEVDGHVHAEAEPADGHSEQVAVAGVGAADRLPRRHEHRVTSLLALQPNSTRHYCAALGKPSHADVRATEASVRGWCV